MHRTGLPVDSRYAAIREQDIVGIAETDLYGHFTSVNERYCQITGYPQDQLLGRRMQDITVPEDLELNFPLFVDCITHGRAFTIEKRYLRPDGARIWVQNHVAPLRSADGIIVGVVALSQDISERKAAEANRRDAEERYRLLGRATHDVIWDWDRRTDHVVWSDSLREVFGYAPCVAEGPIEAAMAWWSSHIHPDEREEVVRTFKASANGGGECWVKEYRFQAADGSYRFVFDRGYIVRDDKGAPSRMVGSMQDVSDLRRAEAERKRLFHLERAARADAERASRLKDEFLAVLSHELRTPLHSMLGWTRYLKEARPDPESVRRGLDSIERNVKLQAHLVESLLDLSSITSGKLHLDLQDLGLEGVVHAAVDTVRESAKARRLHIDVVAAEDGLVAHVDPARSQQIVWNLLTNAVKFSPEGDRIGVHLARAGEGVELRVTDSGEGIDAAFLPHVFDRFRQADSSTTRRHGGLGLGLAIVRELVDAHGGWVRAESEGPGRGSTFTVWLPGARSEVHDNSHPWPDDHRDGRE